MSVVPNVVNKKRKKQESKPQSQLNKCLNEKRRREQENIYIEELAELISASVSDMSSLSVKPDKCAILQETVNQIRRIKQEPGQSDELQQSEVSSSKPTILANDIYGPLLLEALDGFLFVVNIDGKIEFVSENITSFLSYTQDEIVDEIIYNIIHPNDRARFSSNLLPMMSLGNGSNWGTEPSSGLSKRGSFNCRFLMKPDSTDANMEDKQQSSSSSSPQFENMQVSAVFFPFAKENREKEGEGQNRLACVARRIPPNEKSPTSLGVEQFTTRLDVTGKITAIDVSGLSATYSQYLSKELVDHKFQDLCHPSDVPKFIQHLKDTIQASTNTTVVYKLRVGSDRYVPVQTKSKHFHFKQSVNEQEFIMSTHSIIRESDNAVPVQADGNPKTTSTQPSLLSASTSTVGSASPASSASVAVTVSSLVMPNTSYNSTFATMSPANTELVLGDLMSDIFPNATWNIDSSALSQESESNSPNVTCTAATALSTASSSKGSGGQLTNSAFSPEVTTVRSMSGNSSPATPGRVPTPFSRSTGSFSPSPVQVVSGKVSPLSGTMPKSDKPMSGPAEGMGTDTTTSAAKQEPIVSVQANQKLRNLLMQNSTSSEGSGPSNSQKRNSRDEDVVILGRGSNIFENRSQVPRPVAAVVGVPQATISGSNNILRELLNQDDDDVLSEGRSSFSDRNLNSRVSGLLNSSTNKLDMDRQKRMSDNNMLRRLLNNNDDSDSSSSKSEDLIHQLLKSDVSERSISTQSNNRTVDILSATSAEDSSLKSPADTSLGSSAGFSFTDSSAGKRKAPSTSDYPSKRQNAPHAHLAGQNPMLASMLAQTPRTPPSVPTSIVNTIMTQLPQERLPKNLEKKLIHTPYTTASSTSAASTTTTAAAAATSGSQSFGLQTSNRLLLAPTSIQPDVVTSDTRGHVTQHPSSASLQTSTGPMLSNKPSYSAQQQQSFLNRILSGSVDGNLLSRSLSAPATSVQQVIPNTFGIQFAQTAPVAAASDNTSRGLRDMLSDSVAVSADGTSLPIVSNNAQTTQSSDPGLAEILDQIYSLQEEMNVVTTVGDETSDILKILEDVMDTGNAALGSTPVAAPPPTTSPTVQDITEKIAISAIQKQLMSFEGTTPSVPANSVTLQNPLIHTFSQTANLSSPMVRKVAQVPVTLAASSAFTALQQASNGAQPPTYTNSLVTSRVRLPVVTPSGAVISNSQQILGLAAVQRMGLQQSVSLGANVNQIRRSLIERKQKLYLEQKRLLEQQEKQQMTMQTQQPLDIMNAQGASAFPENINELLNNTVAPPNVALQRSTNIPEAQLSPRFSTNLIGQIPSPVAQPSTPSQLSPNQRGSAQSPFSPLSQQPFPSPTPPPVTFQQQQQQQAVLSPHSALASFAQGTCSSQTSSPVPPSASHSPRLQLSPQQQPQQQQQQPQQVSGVTQWPQRTVQSTATANLLQQNPMLNAQLSQTFNSNQVKFSAQQRQQLAMRSLPSPGSVQNPRNSPFQNQADNSFPPLSPIAVFQNQGQQQVTLQQQQTQAQQAQQQQQQQQAQQRVQRTISGPARLTSVRNSQNQQGAASSFPGTEPLLSPQPLQSPSFSQTLSATPVSSYSTTASSGGLTFNVSQDGSFFTFDRQNLQVLTTSVGERARLANSTQVSSDYIRQELRAIVGARAQQALPTQGLTPSQSALATSLAAGTSISLNRQTLEELGLSIEQLPGDAQSFPQSLLSIAGEGESSGTNRSAAQSPRVEEPKPADQKKSLLQQLLSEPT